MIDNKITEPNLPVRIRSRHLALHAATIEKVFTDCVMDLHQVLVLDSVDFVSDGTGFRIHAHDLYGPLPEIVIKDSGDRFLDKDRLSNESCKLIAIVRLRDQIVRWLREGEFLPPTVIEARSIAGFKTGPKTWLAEGKDFLAAYHELRRRLVG